MPARQKAGSISPGRNEATEPPRHPRGEPSASTDAHTTTRVSHPGYVYAPVRKV